MFGKRTKTPTESFILAQGRARGNLGNTYAKPVARTGKPRGNFRAIKHPNTQPDRGTYGNKKKKNFDQGPGLAAGQNRPQSPGKTGTFNVYPAKKTRLPA